MRKFLVGIALSAGMSLFIVACGLKIPTIDRLEDLLKTKEASVERNAEQKTASPESFDSTEEPGSPALPDTSAGGKPSGATEVEHAAGEASPSGETKEFFLPIVWNGSSIPPIIDVSTGPDEECEWKITFEDDFDGDSLDTSKWDTGYKAGDAEAQYYVDDVFEVEDGILTIRAEERQVDDREYASGIITTHQIFHQLYGRFEARIKAPAGQGLWPAFWLMPESRIWPPEIDVMEILGHETDTMYMSNHWSTDEEWHVSKTFGYEGPDFSQDFHTFEAIWTPEEIVWYVDGEERARQTEGVPEESMFLLLNLAVGGEWPGYPDDSTPFPSYMEIDYVRVSTWNSSDSGVNFLAGAGQAGSETNSEYCD